MDFNRIDKNTMLTNITELRRVKYLRVFYSFCISDLNLINLILISFSFNRVFPNYYLVTKRCKKYLAFRECRTYYKFAL